MLHYGRIADEWAAIMIAIVVSTVLTIAVTAVVMRALIGRQMPAAADAAEPSSSDPPEH